MIDFTNFVKINIVYKSTQPIKGTRDTVALLTEDDTITNQIFDNYQDIADAYPSKTAILNYAKVFFDCGGKKLHLYPESGNTIGNKLPDSEIVVTTFTEAYVTSLAELNASKDGIHKKIVVGHGFPGGSQVSKPFGLCKKTVAYNDASKGYEMAIAAYLSKIDAYGINTAADYCYTEEPAIPTYDSLSNTDFEYAIDHNCNVNIELAGKKLNVGGNCLDGNPVVNEYMLILLQQTCTDRLINLLTQKIKGATGTVAIKAVLENELNNYVANGYLDTDKVWKDQDLVISYNGKDYTVVKQGTLIDKGYIVFAVPYADLSAADIALHKAPPVYIVIADAYAIRTIEVNGEVK